MSKPDLPVRDGLPVLAFADRAAFEHWLASAPDPAGAWVKMAKGVAPGLRKADAVDAALCHGWIDGQLGRWDEHHSLTRFTPRRAGSRWSEKNRTRAEQLIAAGQMRPRGLAEIAAAKADGRWDAAYAPASSATVPDDLRAALDAEPEAARFFTTLTGARRYAILYRIAAVKRPETRARRIATFVAMLARGEAPHG